MKLNESGVIFNSEDHTYHLGKKRLSGITGMIGRQLFPEKYSAVPEFILKKAAKNGTRIHNECTAFDILGIADTLEAQQYAELIGKEDINVLLNEYIVSDNKNFASPIDKVGIIDEDLCLFDVKTTAILDLEYVSWQLSIYKCFFEEQNPSLKVKKLFAIHIKNGAKLTEVEIKPIELIKELIRCEVSNEQFDNPFAPVVANKESEMALNLVEGIASIERDLEHLRAYEKDYKKKLLNMFKELNVDKWETDLFIITKSKDHERSRFDKKGFKEHHPELAEQFTTNITVKGGLRTKLK